MKEGVHRCFLPCLVWVATDLLAGLPAAPSSSPLTPIREGDSFRFADDNLSAELVAAEPDAISPVAIAWDADGRLFVAEMIDYPTALTGGRVRLLEDRDGDGHYERATVFAEQLPFPTSVLPWRDGVLVCAAPDILFLKDNDGDGRADERHALFTGFGQGNQQLRVNGLTWGLDNWVYGANGRSDGEVRAVEVQVGSGWAMAGPALVRTNSLRGRDFQFRPATGEFEAIAGRSQFGTTFDDWGNRFLSWNTMPFRHVVIESRYLDRVPLLSGMDASQNLQPPGDDGRVFPLTAPPQVFNNESQTHFNASAGTSVYRGDALGGAYQGNLFAGEPLRNLVHRRILVPKGVTFEALRGEEDKEFLASADPWFHPVNFATGPDGALYVVDFYRLFVEHPGYVPEEMRDKVDWRVGAEHGRIWRIRPKTWKPRGPRPRLSNAKSAELVKHLDDANAWWRQTAQRLLIERQDLSAVPALERLVRTSRQPLGRLHALAALDRLASLSTKLLLMALQDPDARLRENAIRLTESFLGHKADSHSKSEQFSELFQRLTGLAKDVDPHVRRQLALSAGEFPDQGGFFIISVLAASGMDDPWQSLAVLSGVGSKAWDLWSSLADTHSDLVREPTDAQAAFLERLASIVGASREERNLSDAVLWMAANRDKPFGRLALFCSLAEGARQNSGLRRVLDSALIPAAPPEISASDLPTQAATIAAASDSSLPSKLVAIRALGILNPPNGPELLQSFLLPDRPAAVQSTSANALSDLNDRPSALMVFSNWNQFGSTTRRQLIAAASRSSAFATALIDAVEHGAIEAAEVDSSTRQALQKNPDFELRQRAEGLFKRAVATDRERVIREFQPATQLKGDRVKGAAIFGRTCLQCHAMQGRGNAIGPNLYSVASQPKETLLVNILDPSRQVTPDYVTYTLTTSEGETLNGLIPVESASSVTLRRPNAADITVQRARIKVLKAEGRSLMPDGLEQGLTQQDVADLLEFIRQPDDKLLPKDE
jgi:putative membrane-bound dehydrogenase-like protein